jgi:hypothetical protein
LDFLSRIHDFILIPSLTDDIGDDPSKPGQREKTAAGLPREHYGIGDDPSKPGQLPARDMDKIIRLICFVLKYCEGVTEIEKSTLCFLASLESERLSVRELENIIFKSSPPKGQRFDHECLPLEYQVQYSTSARAFDHPQLCVYWGFEGFKKDCRRACSENELGFEHAFSKLTKDEQAEIRDELGSAIGDLSLSWKPAFH